MKRVFLSLWLTIVSSALAISPAQSAELNSLCNKWNVMEFRYDFETGEVFHTCHYHLTSDTVIGELNYLKLYNEETYRGALREGENATIYYIPADSIHEYLLYAFHAQEGDSLKNVWFGPNNSQEPATLVRSTVVSEIKTTNPRIFILDITCVTTYSNTEEVEHKQCSWIEGIGLDTSPDGADGLFSMPGSYTSFLLCAYKNEVQIYVSPKGEDYGCNANNTTGVISHADKHSNDKVLFDGQLYIIRNGKIYNALGTQLR